MSQYDKLAEIYDYLVSGIDYEDWADYIEEILRKFSSHTEYVADLACGTGNTTLPLAQRGYQVYGIDLSPAMLAKAAEKAKASGLKPCFLKQDMRELSLPRTMDLVTCYHDGLNYIIEPDDLRMVFKKVYQSLRPGGLFIFDLNAVEKLASAGGDTTFVDDRDLSLIWETGYDQENDVWEIRLTGFIRTGQLYDKFVEVHKERAYRMEEALAFLHETGFEVLDVFHGFSFEPPGPTSRRLFYVACRPAGGNSE
ncbi:MAG: class I SAM-dependent methyltransferase [Thermincola sp.]|jgi:SAM-dependent methyltransferase|nr:class I SAM-dependent methyltransferase [Thermincola sp.]